MRSILDTLTEQYKTEKQAEYVQRVLKDSVNSLDRRQRIKFIQAALKHLGPFLPPELKNEPPERFARNYETIIRVYVKSIDKINRLLRTM